MSIRTLTRQEARRLAVRAQLLTAERPTEIVPTIEALTMLQIDPTAAIAPSADLMLWTRLGGGYRPEQLTAALDARQLWEHNAMVRPVSQLDLFRPTMAISPRGEQARAWLDANDGFRRDVLARLESDGPLLSRDIADTSQVTWPSSGWTNDRNVTQLLEMLAIGGHVAIAGRQGRQRLWDLGSRVLPAATEPLMDLEEARRERGRRQLLSLGIVRVNTGHTPAEPLHIDEQGVEAEVEGLPGTWRVAEELLGGGFAGRTALLSPFDRMVHERGRLVELFDFEYTLEMYKPAAKRRWGYFALPILHEDRLVGKLDAAADRRAGVLRVARVHEDGDWDAATRAAVDAEIAALAAWLELAVERADRA